MVMPNIEKVLRRDIKGDKTDRITFVVVAGQSPAVHGPENTRPPAHR